MMKFTMVQIIRAMMKQNKVYFLNPSHYNIQEIVTKTKKKLSKSTKMSLINRQNFKTKQSFMIPFLTYDSMHCLFF